MSDSEPIAFRPQTEQQDGRSKPGGTVQGSGQGAGGGQTSPFAQVAFNRQELSAILDVYGRRVAAGDWRDYAMDFDRERAVFSIFRRASEVPLYRIEKHPRLARKQGAYAVISATGHILKRGHDLKRVLAVLEPRMHLVG